MGEEVRLLEGVHLECCCLLLSPSCSPLLAAACTQTNESWKPRTIAKKDQSNMQRSIRKRELELMVDKAKMKMVDKEAKNAVADALLALL